MFYFVFFFFLKVNGIKYFFFFFQAEDGIRDYKVTGVQTCALPISKLTDDVIYHDFSIFSEIASTSSGVELMNCEIIVLGNSARSTSELVMAHAVMKDAIDAAAVREALRRAGLAVECELAERDRARLINV